MAHQTVTKTGRAPLPHRTLQVASYMRAVLRTLSQCHHHRILHRDVKPGEHGVRFNASTCALLR